MAHRAAALVSRLLWPLLVTCCWCTTAQELPANGLNGYSLHPPYFNLAEGTKITATATCGLDDAGRSIQDLYCKLVGGPMSGEPSQTIQGQYCDICSQGLSDRAHPITNAIDGTERWWQSPPLSRSTEYNEVNVTLDLGQVANTRCSAGPQSGTKQTASLKPGGMNFSYSLSCFQCYYFFIYRLQCDCQHHTCGVSCDQCCPGYHQLPWKPATTYSANECEACNCHHHAFECYYDPEIDRKRLSLDIHGHHRGGGVCLNCQHHTTGVNCERCIPTYYRSPDHPINSPQACLPCDCQMEFTDGTCEDLTGRCFCKPNYTGDDCNSCASGFIGFPECYLVRPNHAAGTVENSCRPDPRTGTCICKPGFTGDHCDTCAPGFYGLNCQACQCLGPGCYDGSCDLVSGDGVCRNGFQGSQCDQCAPGYFYYPLCQLCGCSTIGSLPEGCDASGRCLCRPEFQGPRCEQCRSGFHSFPNCQECVCDPRTSLDSSCTVSGICHCRPNYSGASCDQCAPGYYGYPSCTPGTCHPAGSVHFAGQCECRRHVEGAACDRCKPLYWNLSPDSPNGCSSKTRCECNIAGTLSGVAECAQETGQCHCKPSVCSGACSACKDGYYNLQHHDYFGCQSCQCDIGGSLGPFCEDQNGQCRCRSNVEGPKCNVPRPDHYFPDLHHLKFEIEEGTMMDGRPVRFGYNLLEFPNFSWRGYAQMSSIQSRVLVSVSITSPDLYHVVLRFANWAGSAVQGRVSVTEDEWSYYCGNCKCWDRMLVSAVMPFFLCHSFFGWRHIPFPLFLYNQRAWSHRLTGTVRRGKEPSGLFTYTSLSHFLLIHPGLNDHMPILFTDVTQQHTRLLSLCCFSHLSSSYTASPFCLSSAMSLSAFFNNGAMPCACHEVGAESDTCEQFGGQCRCRPNVIGRDCSMCATGYWGFPNCRPCNCGSRLCEPVNGECICPPRTLLPECSQCEPQTFGCHPIVGCEVCNCSHGGVLSHDDSCDSLNGQCSCKNNIIGRQCDRCALGYYGYPNCRPCECNEAGTEEEVCDSVTGRCLCKENVQGARCDQCRIGTFHLDPTNPKGCTSCFCFGATDRCQSSDKRRTEIIDMKGWVLLGADRQEVVVNEYPDQDLVEADLSDVPDVYQDLYWNAPNTYLGDKVKKRRNQC
uniref:Laminin, alpha 5 n=1 Tax=Oryzias sinensis TaxID=183150 RepID=A0A8C8DVN0_9TELE